MDRSRRGGTKQERPPSAQPVPASSRLTVRAKRNRKRPVSLWSRVPNRGAVLDACKRTLRRSLPALAATVVVLALGTGLWFGYRFVTTSQRFAIAAIRVEGASQLSEDSVRAALPVKVGENIFTTDLGDVTRALRANPWIRSASAHRVLPETLVVEIREHVASAVVQLGAELYLADDTGHPFKRAQLETGEAEKLPIVTGIDRDEMRTAPHETAELIVRALGVLERWRGNALRPEISEIHVDAHHAITLRTYDRGVAIQLGALRELDARLTTFDAAWSELTDSERARVTALHLDARSDQVTVAFAKD
jgi:cell division septal protein FtsQ